MAEQTSFYKIRPMEKDDFGFICDAFWRSSKQTKRMAEIKETVLMSECLVAVLHDSNITILSFIVFDRIGNHIFRYTKQAFRGLGINKAIANNILKFSGILGRQEAINEIQNP